MKDGTVTQTDFPETIDRELSPGTRKRYDEIIGALSNRLKEEGKAITAANIIDAYVKRSPTMSYGYWLVAKAAIKNFALNQNEIPAIDAIATMARADSPNNWTRRAIGLHFDLRNRIEQRLRSGLTKSQYDMILFGLVRAGVLTGLRPSEWVSSKIVEIDGKPWLQVKTAKAKKDEAPLRHLGIHVFNDVDQEIIRTILEAAVNIGAEDWGPVVASASRLFRETVRALGGDSERIRLYNCRHQFSANAKFALYPSGLGGEKAVAALMGHQVTGISKRYAGAPFSEIGQEAPAGYHLVTCVPAFLPEEAESVIDSTTVGGRSRSRRARKPTPAEPSIAGVSFRRVA